MKAIVKDIKILTAVEDNGYEDIFDPGMKVAIGKTIECKEIPEFPNWFTTEPPYNWYYHKSWLEFPEEKSELMKFKIHMTLSDGSEDVVTVEGETIDEIQVAARQHCTQRNATDAWSEQIRETAKYNEGGDVIG